MFQHCSVLLSSWRRNILFCSNSSWKQIELRRGKPEFGVFVSLVFTFTSIVWATPTFGRNSIQFARNDDALSQWAMRDGSGISFLPTRIFRLISFDLLLLQTVISLDVVVDFILDRCVVYFVNSPISQFHFEYTKRFGECNKVVSFQTEKQKQINVSANGERRDTHKKSVHLGDKFTVRKGDSQTTTRNCKRNEMPRQNRRQKK